MARRSGGRSTVLSFRRKRSAKCWRRLTRRGAASQQAVSVSFPPNLAVKVQRIAVISGVIHDIRMSDDELMVRLRDRKGEAVTVAGVYLDLRFYIKGRFRYSFYFGLTDAHGACRTTFGKIERQLEANQRLFLMDYNTALSDCDTLIGIVAPTASELVERQVARLKWWPKEPSISEAANDRGRCQEQKFELHRGRGNSFELLCDVHGSA